MTGNKLEQMLIAVVAAAGAGEHITKKKIKIKKRKKEHREQKAENKPHKAP